MSNEVVPKKNRKKIIYGSCAAVLIALSTGAIVISQVNDNEQPKTEVNKKNTNNNTITNKGKSDKNKGAKKSSNSNKKETDDPFEKVVGLITEGANSIFNSPQVEKALSFINPTVSAATKEEDKNSSTTNHENPLNLNPILPPIGPNVPVDPNPPIILPPLLQAPTISVMNGVVELGSVFNPEYFASVSDIYGSVELIVDASQLDMSTSGVYPVYYNSTANSKGLVAEQKVAYITVNSRPVITTTTDVVHVPVRSSVNVLDYVSAFDLEDGDISGSIVFEGFVQTQHEGETTITYYVSDSAGMAAYSKSITFITTNDAPTISARPMAIQIDTEFNPMAGVTAFDTESGDLTSSVQVIHNGVDMTKEGTYSVTYFVEDGNGKDVTVTRRVFVTNEAPVIHAEDKTFHVREFDTFTMEMALEGVSVTDREDGSIPGSNIVVNAEQLAAIDSSTVGSYPLTYTVKDSHGKSSEKTIQVRFINDAPEIHGIDDVTIHVGSAFNPLDGVTVTDTEEGSLLSKLIVEDLNQFDSNVPGVYQFNYSVTDSDGAETTINRKVTVINDLPVISGVKDQEIKVGDLFDPLAGISVSDTETPTNEIELIVEGEVDTTQVGTYQLTYIATDGHGGVTKELCTITVVEEEVELTE